MFYSRHDGPDWPKRTSTRIVFTVVTILALGAMAMAANFGLVGGSRVKVGSLDLRSLTEPLTLTPALESVSVRSPDPGSLAIPSAFAIERTARVDLSVEAGQLSVVSVNPEPGWTWTLDDERTELTATSIVFSSSAGSMTFEATVDEGGVVTGTIASEAGEATATAVDQLSGRDGVINVQASSYFGPVAQNGDRESESGSGSSNLDTDGGFVDSVDETNSEVADAVPSRPERSGDSEADGRLDDD